MTPAELEAVVSGGESAQVEFKATTDSSCRRISKPCVLSVWCNWRSSDGTMEFDGELTYPKAD